MKAVGPDRITNEFYKEGGEKIEKGLHDLLESIGDEEEVPIDWSKDRKKRYKKLQTSDSSKHNKKYIL